MPATPSQTNHLHESSPVFSPHPSVVPGLPPNLPKKKEAPDSHERRSNFSQKYFDVRVQRKTAAMTEAVAGGWWSLSGTTTANRQMVVSSLNVSKEFADSAAPLTKGALATFLSTEMELHRKSRKKDERATGAGDQAHTDYMKALDRALQAEDDFLEFASRKKETSNEKKAKSERMTDKGKAMRGKAFRTRESDEDEDDSDDDAKEKGAGGEDGPDKKKAKKARFAPAAFAQQCMSNSELSRRDRVADQLLKRDLKQKEINLETKKLEARERESAALKVEAEAQRKSETVKTDALVHMVSQQAQLMPLLITSLGEIAKSFSRASGK